MFRVLTILAAIVALAVSAAPVASAGPNSKTTGHSAGLAPDFGLYLSLRKAPPKPPGLGVTYFKGELVGIEPSLRKALPKPRGISGDVYHYELSGANDYGLLLDAVGKEWASKRQRETGVAPPSLVRRKRRAPLGSGRVGRLLEAVAAVPRLPEHAVLQPTVPSPRKRNRRGGPNGSLLP